MIRTENEQKTEVSTEQGVGRDSRGDDIRVETPFVYLVDEKSKIGRDALRQCKSTICPSVAATSRVEVDKT